MTLTEEVTEVGTGIFAQVTTMGHEQVVFCHDRATGLKAIIGVHSTALGPALGGLRIWNYDNDEQALVDVLRLSRGMSLKNSVAGLNLGGGKAVIIGDARKIKSEALLKRFAEYVHRLSGTYITAEDVGVTTADIDTMSAITPYVSGKPVEKGGSGDPSPFTAYGVYLGMKASAKKAYGSDSLAGKAIAVQGTGHVGSYLLGHLQKEGAKLFVSDFYEERAAKAAAEFGATMVGKDEIFDLDVDIFAPCALGAIINDNTIDRLKCRVVAGAANNQLADEKVHGYGLKDRGIVYAPDFLINAGGVINVYQELLGYDKALATQKVEKIYDITARLLDRAEKEGITSHEAALNAALKRIETKGDIEI